MKIFQWILVLCLAPALMVSADETGNGIAWKKSLGHLHHHPDIRISLWASEPLVVDPVDICFDHHGNAYVVEMRDYPYGFGEDRRGGGVVRILRDLDGDNRADSSSVFADNLSFPTTITPWMDGVLVGAPPQVLYLADTDGDDVADVRQVMIDGFELGVTDSNMNSLQFGPDNRIHGANGGAGGRIWSPASLQDSFDLNDSDFAWNPRDNSLERTFRTGGGFGLVFNRFGHSFTTYNIDYLQQQIIPLKYLTSDATISPADVTRTISAHGAMARIYPVSRQETRVNHPEQAGYFSSAGGMGLLEVDYFGPRLADSIFVCDVVGNLVHRDQLHRSGPSWIGKRAPEEQKREFIASENLWFRPTGLEFGPDGALYLPDMHRAVIEHPDYIPARVLKDMDFRAGDDMGRIYRITPADPDDLPQAFSFNLTPESGWHKALESSNPWTRQTARRLLVYRTDPNAGINTKNIRIKARTHHQAETRVEALLTLAGLKALDAELLNDSLNDTDPSVVTHAIRLCETLAQLPVPELEKLLNHNDASVRFQAALTLSKGGEKLLLGASELTSLGLRDFLDPDHQMALRILAGDNAPALLTGILKTKRQEVITASMPLVEQVARITTSHSVLQNLLEQAVGSHNANHLAECLTTIDRGIQQNENRDIILPALSPVLIMISRDLEESAWAGFIQLASQCPGEEIKRTTSIISARANAIAADTEENPERRMQAIRALGSTRSPEMAEKLGQLLSSLTSPGLQQVCLESLANLRHDQTAKWILDAWPVLDPSLRTRTIQLILSRTPYRTSLLDGLESGKIQVSELNLDLEQRRTMLRWSPQPIRERAAKWFGDEEYSNRKAIVEEWLAQLPDSGSPEDGSAIFAQRCAVCHIVGDTGTAIGPELTGVFHRSDEDLLSHILDPNMAINPNYVMCVAETNDGDIHTGLLMDQSSSQIEMKMLTGDILRIPRSSIAEFQMAKRSLMPEGLELGLTPQDMKSLILFLQTSR